MIIKILKRFVKKRNNFKLLGNNSVVSKGKFFGANQTTIGDNCYIGPEAYWYGIGGINIGEGTIIGPKSTIWSANHNYESDVAIPYDKQVINKAVIVGRACWFGFGVHICPGVTIGDGAVIAMGSVVTKDIPEFAIVGGNPAKVIGYRKNVVNFQRLLQDKKYYLETKNE
ncbi:acyltransferase [Pseudoalteromonas sp. KS88]|uniref:acyltransferase n=1 Tax=Pseudoalteromonas sp. KS88 TaxID=2109918 RepID=UPI001080B46D|nr:acyltransferase [Pseudoalteromonas sp. KS88]TGE79857.1 acyltransferase [Pseudoalteromonas sp. KS88]